MCGLGGAVDEAAVTAMWSKILCSTGESRARLRSSCANRNRYMTSLTQLSSPYRNLPHDMDMHTSCSFARLHHNPLGNIGLQR